MSVIVHIDGNRQFDVDEFPDGVTTCGAYADRIAREYLGSSDVPDRQFSWKVDGVVADRDDSLDSLGDGVLLELVEVTPLAETTEAAVVEEKPRRSRRAKADEETTDPADTDDGDGDGDE